MREQEWDLGSCNFYYPYPFLNNLDIFVCFFAQTQNIALEMNMLYHLKDGVMFADLRDHNMLYDLIVVICKPICRVLFL